MIVDMSASIPAVGERLGPWTVEEDPIRVAVRCDTCGVRRRKKLSDLRLGRFGRCPKCLAGTKRIERDGESSHPIYRTWATMRHRCGPTAGPRTVRRYHDRGISVCAEWQGSYDAFKAWALTAGFKPGLQLDRRNNDLGYTPENCRFVTSAENNNNRDNTRRVTAWGETKPMSAWVYDPRCVVDYQCLSDRLFRSNSRFTPERAMATPRRVHKNNRAEGAGYWPMPTP